MVLRFVYKIEILYVKYQIVKRLLKSIICLEIGRLPKDLSEFDAFFKLLFNKTQCFWHKTNTYCLEHVIILSNEVLVFFKFNNLAACSFFLFFFFFKEIYDTVF